jgi:hypothetical protein
MATRKLPTNQFKRTERLLERLRERAKAEEDWANLPPAEVDAIRNHPAVQIILKAFPGSKIIGVRTLN